MTTRWGKTYDNVGNRYKVFSKEEQDQWPSGHKKCTKCKLLLPFEAFGPHKNGRDGLTQVCKECNANKSRLEYATKPYEQIILERARSRAKRKGMECSITVEDIKIPATCPALGIPLVRGSGRMTDNSPALDRIDPSRGYVKGNVQVISNRANRIKTDATPAEVEAVAQWMRDRI